MAESHSLRNKAREILAIIPAAEKRELVAKSRWTCDSHWMMAMVMNAGWDVANKMNLQIGQATGRVELLRPMKILSLNKPGDEKEFMTLMSLSMETFITQDYFDYEFSIMNSGKGIGIIKQCYAYTKVKSISVDKDYECGCFGLRRGWYEAMGVDVKEQMIKCLKDGDSQCEIVLESIVFPEAVKSQKQI